MPFFSYLDETSGMRDIAMHRPETYIHLHRFTQDILRGPSQLEAHERELIAAFVSRLNECTFCHGAHSATAEHLGADVSVIEALADDIETAPVRESLKPVLRYVKKLNETPTRMTAEDARAVFDAGWDEDSLHDAIVTCALFNLYNRIVEGHGIKAGENNDVRRRGVAIAEMGYDSYDPETMKRKKESSRS